MRKLTPNQSSYSSVTNTSNKEAYMFNNNINKNNEKEINSKLTLVIKHSNTFKEKPSLSIFDYNYNKKRISNKRNSFKSSSSMLMSKDEKSSLEIKETKTSQLIPYTQSPLNINTMNNMNNSNNNNNNIHSTSIYTDIIREKNISNKADCIKPNNFMNLSIYDKNENESYSKKNKYFENKKMVINYSHNNKLIYNKNKKRPSSTELSFTNEGRYSDRNNENNENKENSNDNDDNSVNNTQNTNVCGSTLLLKPFNDNNSKNNDNNENNVADIDTISTSKIKTIGIENMRSPKNKNDIKIKQYDYSARINNNKGERELKELKESYSITHMSNTNTASNHINHINDINDIKKTDNSGINRKKSNKISFKRLSLDIESIYNNKSTNNNSSNKQTPKLIYNKSTARDVETSDIDYNNKEDNSGYDSNKIENNSNNINFQTFRYSYPNKESNSRINSLANSSDNLFNRNSKSNSISRKSQCSNNSIEKEKAKKNTNVKFDLVFKENKKTGESSIDNEENDGNYQVKENCGVIKDVNNTQINTNYINSNFSNQVLTTTTTANYNNTKTNSYLNTNNNDNKNNSKDNSKNNSYTNVINKNNTSYNAISSIKPKPKSVIKNITDNKTIIANSSSNRKRINSNISINNKLTATNNNLLLPNTSYSSIKNYSIWLSNHLNESKSQGKNIGLDNSNSNSNSNSNINSFVNSYNNNNNLSNKLININSQSSFTKNTSIRNLNRSIKINTNYNNEDLFVGTPISAITNITTNKTRFLNNNNNNSVKSLLKFNSLKNSSIIAEYENKRKSNKEIITNIKNSKTKFHRKFSNLNKYLSDNTNNINTNTIDSKVINKDNRLSISPGTNNNASNVNNNACNTSESLFIDYSKRTLTSLGNNYRRKNYNNITSNTIMDKLKHQNNYYQNNKSSDKIINTKARLNNISINRRNNKKVTKHNYCEHCYSEIKQDIKRKNNITNNNSNSEISNYSGNDIKIELNNSINNSNYTRKKVKVIYGNPQNNSNNNSSNYVDLKQNRNFSNFINYSNFSNLLPVSLRNITYKNYSNDLKTVTEKSNNDFDNYTYHGLNNKCQCTTKVVKPITSLNSNSKSKSKSRDKLYKCNKLDNTKINNIRCTSMKHLSRNSNSNINNNSNYINIFIVNPETGDLHKLSNKDKDYDMLNKYNKYNKYNEYIDFNDHNDNNYHYSNDLRNTGRFNDSNCSNYKLDEFRCKDYINRYNLGTDYDDYNNDDIRTDSCFVYQKRNIASIMKSNKSHNFNIPIEKDNHRNNNTALYSKKRIRVVKADDVDKAENTNIIKENDSNRDIINNSNGISNINYNYDNDNENQSQDVNEDVETDIIITNMKSNITNTNSKTKAISKLINKNHSNIISKNSEELNSQRNSITNAQINENSPSMSQSQSQSQLELSNIDFTIPNIASNDYNISNAKNNNITSTNINDVTSTSIISQSSFPIITFSEIRQLLLKFKDLIFTFNTKTTTYYNLTSFLNDFTKNNFLLSPLNTVIRFVFRNQSVSKQIVRDSIHVSLLLLISVSQMNMSKLFNDESIESNEDTSNKKQFRSVVEKSLSDCLLSFQIIIDLIQLIVPIFNNKDCCYDSSISQQVSSDDIHDIINDNKDSKDSKSDLTKNNISMNNSNNNIHRFSYQGTETIGKKKSKYLNSSFLIDNNTNFNETLDYINTDHNISRLSRKDNQEETLNHIITKRNILNNTLNNINNNTHTLRNLNTSKLSNNRERKEEKEEKEEKDKENTTHYHLISNLIKLNQLNQKINKKESKSKDTENKADSNNNTSINNIRINNNNSLFILNTSHNQNSSFSDTNNNDKNDNEDSNSKRNSLCNSQLLINYLTKKLEITNSGIYDTIRLLIKNFSINYKKELTVFFSNINTLKTKDLIKFINSKIIKTNDNFNNEKLIKKVKQRRSNDSSVGVRLIKDIINNNNNSNNNSNNNISNYDASAFNYINDTSIVVGENNSFNMLLNNSNNINNESLDHLGNTNTICSSPYLNFPLMKKYTLCLEVIQVLGIMESFEEKMSEINVSSNNIGTKDDNYNAATRIMSTQFKPRNELFEFLNAIKPFYEIIVYSCGEKQTVDRLLDAIENFNNESTIYFDHRLYKEHCLMNQNCYIKNLKLLGRDLRKTVMIDCSILSCGLNKNNSIVVKPFINNALENGKIDTTLVTLRDLLVEIAYSDEDDIRPLIRKLTKSVKRTNNHNKKNS